MADSDRVPFDVNDHKQVQDRTRRVKDRDRDNEVTIKTFMSHKSGRAWMWDHLSACGLYRLSARAGDAHMTYFNEGERNVGLRLLAQLRRACPEFHAIMTEENASD